MRFGLIARASLGCAASRKLKIGSCLYTLTNIHVVYFGNLQRQQQCSDEGGLGA